MNTPEEPVRLLLDGSGASDELRHALMAARDDLPSNAQVEAMLARFPVSGGTGGEGGSAPGGTQAGAAKVGALVKSVAGVVVVASLGAVVIATRSSEQTNNKASVSVAIDGSAASASRALEIPEASVAVVSVVASELPPPVRPLRASSGVASSASLKSAGPVRGEVEIMREAYAARAEPLRLLELVNEHARSYPSGISGQERELLRVEALLALNRRSEARAVAEAFRKANPNSAHVRRLDALLSP